MKYLIPLLLLSTAFAAQEDTRSVNPRATYVRTHNGTLVVLPAQKVCDGIVESQRIIQVPNSEYVVVRRRQHVASDERTFLDSEQLTKAKDYLTAINTKTWKVTDIELKEDELVSDYMMQVNSNGILLASTGYGTGDEQYTYIIADLKSGGVKRVEIGWVLLSPSSNMLLLWNPGSPIKLLDFDLNLVRSIDVRPYQFGMWNKDGSAMLLRAEGSDRNIIAAYELSSGQIRPANETEKRAMFGEGSLPEVYLKNGVLAGPIPRMFGQEAVGDPVGQVLSFKTALPSGPPKENSVPPERLEQAEITPASRLIEALDSGAGILFAWNGDLYVRRFSWEGQDTWLVVDESRQKIAAMAKAKQVGVACHIYSADHDDALPRNADWKSAIEPYTKNRKLMEGFVYLGNGEKTTEIDDLPGWPMGYVETPYGRAYVYGDSHVVWRKPGEKP